MERKGSCCPLVHEKHHCLHNLSVCKLRPYTGHFLHFFVYVGFISLNKFLSAKSFQRGLALHQFKKLAVKITHQWCLFKTITLTTAPEENTLIYCLVIMHLCSVSTSFANEKDVPFDIFQIFQLNLLNTVQLFGSFGLLGVCFVGSSCFHSGSKENKAVLLALLKPKVKKKKKWKKKIFFLEEFGDWHS